jgi:hypothetical protein
MWICLIMFLALLYSVGPHVETASDRFGQKINHLFSGKWGSHKEKDKKGD